MSTATAYPLVGRELNEVIRIAVVATLDAEAPRPWQTKEVQGAFAPRNHARVYNALRWLEKRGDVQQFREPDCCWWASKLVEPMCGYPDCYRPAFRVRQSLYSDGKGGWYWGGGYACVLPQHAHDVADQPWPWWS